MRRSSFYTDNSAHVAAIFAFCLVPIIAMMGVCLDLQSQIDRKNKVQAVLDSAVLAAAKVMQSGSSNADITASLVNFVSPQVDSLPGLDCETPNVVFPTGERTIQATLSCTQDTGLMQIIGPEEMGIEVGATATYATTAIDVAFMFDVSGSMSSGNRLVDLKTAATDALDILLPSTASADVIANTRIAIASYSSMLNAGPYFEQVTGLEPSRDYSDQVAIEIDDSEQERGRRYSEIRVLLYDAKTGNRVAEIGNNAIIKVEPEELESMTIVVEPKASHRHYRDFESFELELRGTETHSGSESVEPYTLYGDSGLGDLDGEEWSTGEFELVVRGFDENGLLGRELIDKTINFELFKDGDVRLSDETYTLTSTCVWERDGTERFTDAAPGPGKYLAAHSAWFRQYDPSSPAGYWAVGFNENGEQEYTGSSCSTPAPIELTNNRGQLVTYISTLTAGGGTAGHLGVAWTWYLISDEWSAIFDGTAKPAAFTDTDIKKAVILMTDGDFNEVGHTSQGDSATQALALCAGMKLKGIRIYSVAFKAPSAGQDTLRQCASDPDMYFLANDRDELRAAYKRIAVALSDLRIAE